jgi:hexosaminidase
MRTLSAHFPRAFGLAFAAALAFMPLKALAEAGAAPAILPAPVSMTVGQGHFLLRSGLPLVAQGKGAGPVADYLAGLLRRTRGLTLSRRSGAPAKGSVVLRIVADPALADEAYRLEVREDAITVTARTPAGLFYGAGALWQLATETDAQGQPAEITAVDIADAPRFAWRGLMIDSARHMQSIDDIKRLIDVMALHRFNVLHWHLTDDQGWRLQIRKYPRLTEVGAWRVPAGPAAAADIDPSTGKPRLYGGFYTQAQAREVVAYAAARHVTVVPEIEMPGHALAAVVAYPALGSAPAPAAVSSDWGVFPYLFNLDDKTFAFLDDVLAEVMQVFPSAYIHVGGDEAAKDQWKANPEVQARMKALGLADEKAAQGYFAARVGNYLSAHGRKLIGWDEILDGVVPADATVESWRGPQGAVAAAKAGHDTVMAAWPTLYFDNRQTDLADEPPGRGRVVALKEVYDFDPTPPELTAAERGHVLGVEASLWTEHMRTDARVEHMAFPRAAAVAELGWSQPQAHDWADFSRRLAPWAARYRALGVKASDTGDEVKVEASLDRPSNTAIVTLSTRSAFGDLRYTLDGAAPTPASPRYSRPLVVDLPANLQAAAFDGDRLLAAPVVRRLDPLSLRRKASQELKTCSNKLVISLEDDAPLTGDRATFLIDIMNPCWIYPDADLTGIASITAAVGQVPFNFQIGADRAKIALRPPATPQGELEVRLDSCDGERIATLPLAPAAASPAVTELTGVLPAREGRHDLCLTFTGRSIDPMWAIDWLQLNLQPAAAKPEPRP